MEDTPQELGPYTPPESDLRDDPDSERQRRLDDIGHEAELLGLALFLVFLGGTCFFLGGGGERAKMTTLLDRSQLRLGILIGATGLPLAWLAPKSWIPAAVACFALVFWGFPFGAPLGCYGLFLLLSPSGRRVLSREHKALRARTPSLQPSRVPRVLATILFVSLMFARGVALSWWALKGS